MAFFKIPKEIQLYFTKNKVLYNSSSYCRMLLLVSNYLIHVHRVIQHYTSTFVFFSFAIQLGNPLHYLEMAISLQSPASFIFQSKMDSLLPDETSVDSCINSLDVSGKDMSLDVVCCLCDSLIRHFFPTNLPLPRGGGAAYCINVEMVVNSNFHS